MTELPQRKQLVQVRRARLGFELVSFVISFLELFPEGWTANLAALPRSLWAGDPLEYRQSDQRSELVPSLSTVCVCVCMHTHMRMCRLKVSIREINSIALHPNFYFGGVCMSLNLKPFDSVEPAH